MRGTEKKSKLPRFCKCLSQFATAKECAMGQKYGSYISFCARLKNVFVVVCSLFFIIEFSLSSFRKREGRSRSRRRRTEIGLIRFDQSAWIRQLIRLNLISRDYWLRSDPFSIEFLFFFFEVQTFNSTAHSTLYFHYAH